jgi:uncharacterized coiled-coil protein SlyX
MIDREARKRIAVLEETAVGQDRAIAALQEKMSRQVEVSGRLTRAEAEIARLSTALDSLRTTVASEQQRLSTQTDLVKADLTRMSAAIDSLCTAVSNAKPPPRCVQPLPRNAPDSMIISDFPVIFAQFRGKWFTLLWRGSRDGFGAPDFHCRCDGHRNTLTLILDVGGSIFGGFTPVACNSGGGGSGYRADPSGTSFLFTLKNPHNFPAKTFALKSEEKAKATSCHPCFGPCFGFDIWVNTNCNNTFYSDTMSIGRSYFNDTGVNEIRFFTGSRNFKVEEIEVFEITN